ncbi:CD5 antigen-like [Amphiura filiformis]|uniref:CD5 antigen-like n=1 Tax=Amphiura filiformis TaxID=82378 RepID=UPI003B20D1CB
MEAIFFCVCLCLALVVTVHCRGSPRAIRLVGPIAYIGEVQIFHKNQWVSVCQDQWNLKNAHVVCGQLGYANRALSARSMSYAQMDGDRGDAIQGFKCRGNEARLDLCPILAGNWSRQECSAGMAGVICQTPRESSYPVRLVGGDSDHEGRVEIKHGGEWNTVCDRGWDKPDADIICHQIGYKTAVRASTGAEYGQGTGTILLSNVQCKQDDLKYRYDVRYCNVTDWYPDEDECTHARDAGVVCDAKDTELEVRLTGPQHTVQIKYNDDWMSICDDNWNKNDAVVVCRQLGFQSATKASKTGYHGWQGYYLRNFLCTGNETRLDQCKRRGEWTLQTCGNDRFAGVQCTGGSHTIIHHMSGGSAEGGSHYATHNKVSAVESVIVVAIVCGILLFIFSGYFIGHKARQRRKRKAISLQLDETETGTISLEENEMDQMNATDEVVEETDSHYVTVQDNIPLVQEEDCD